LRRLKRFVSYVLITCLAGILGIFLVAPASHANTPLVCNMSTVTGDDDGSFPMTLPFSLQLGNTNYNQIYYSTNGLMSFGRPDGNFWSYPQTPSVTLAGRDWVSFGPGAYTSYGYNENSFCIEWSVRPFPQSSGPLTQIRLVVNVFPNGGWHGEITTLGWIPPDIRRGIVWEQNGTPLPIEAAFDVNGGVPVEVEPAPAPTSFTEPPAIPTQCWDGSTVYSPATCPAEPAPTQCWDGSSVTWRDTCPPVPPDIVCWNDQVIPWNQTCPQVPPLVECWNGTSVNWNEQCPVQPTPTPSPEPQPSVSPEPTLEPSLQPIEPSPLPSEPVVLPSENPSPIPVPSFSSPSEYPWQPEGPVAVPSLDPEPEISFPEPLTPDPIESSFPDLDLPSIDLPSNNVITEITDTEIDTFVEDFTQSGTISDIETEQLINTFLGDGFISEDEVSGLSDSLIEDGVLSEDERELLVDVILEQADGNAISTELIDELGLDYEDLPDDQPVMLDNGVILFAEVADALEIFENPSEILGAVFTDPGKALTAVANIGADMTPEQREESQTVVVASIIVGQIISTTNLITGRIR
jgi:hypothetical protein